MMNDRRRRRRQILKVDHYDGQCIYSEHELFYELGGYLGGGAAGVVYEAFCTRTKRHVAIKILNPVGYKLLPSTLLSRCVVAIQGKPLDDGDDDDEEDEEDEDNGADRVVFGRYGRRRHPYGAMGFDDQDSSRRLPRMRLENVWWLIHPTTKQAVAAYEDPRTRSLRELSLPQCIDVWGPELELEDHPAEDLAQRFAQLEAATQDVPLKNQVLKIPRIPKKFIHFAATRRTIHREIAHMSGLELHENVLRLDEALELVQDSKCTTFLVLELAAGGELFDRIKLDCGTDEPTARRYFQQLISGVAFCHASGICHRDLKPENLLLADNEELSTLKIADFGLSAIFAMTENDLGGIGSGSGVGGVVSTTATGGPSTSASTTSAVQAIRRLRSVVGSPHYVAPEVLMDAGQGYDGAKADAWSIGVILYAMLAGNLPFGKDLLSCLRFDKFKKWCYATKYSDEDPTAEGVIFPSWFFPGHFSFEVKSLLAQLLCPDATMRLAVEDAQRHPWVLGQSLRQLRHHALDNDPQASPLADEEPAPGNSPINSPHHLHPRGLGAITHAPQTLIDQEQLSLGPSNSGQHLQQLPLQSTTSPFRWTAPTTTTTTTTAPPTHLNYATTSSLCPPSPQKILRGHLPVMGGYMPSVDETAPLSGQTPVNSPRAEDRVDLASGSQSSSSPTALAPSSQVFERSTLPTTSDRSNAEGAVDDSRQRLPTTSSAESSSTGTSNTSTRIPPRRRFTSPPLAIGRGSLLQRRHQVRRNSPPELFLSRYGKGIKFEAIQTTFDLDVERFRTAVRMTSDTTTATSPATTMPPGASSSMSLPNTPSAGTPATPNKCDPPSYQDVVARSTRFITALPAQLVLSELESLLTSEPNPLAAFQISNDAPYRVSVDWDKYQLDVHCGGILACTVQVFLFQRGVYLVEFRRGQVEIFQFKRFYEDVREKLADTMDLSPNHRMQLSTNATAPSPLPTSRMFPRKRNKSISLHDDLMR